MVQSFQISDVRNLIEQWCLNKVWINLKKAGECEVRQVAKRLIKLDEAQKYDCYSCADVQQSISMKNDEPRNGIYLRGKACPHSKCPYAKEVDLYDTYEEFLEAQSKTFGSLIGKIAFS